MADIALSITKYANIKITKLHYKPNLSIDENFG